MTASAPPLIEVNRLEVCKEKTTILRLEHLSVAEGESLAIVGPNGAGKSTLLVALGLLARPSRGEILIRGKRIRPQDELVYRRQLAVVLQDPFLLRGTVFDNVAAGLRFRGLGRQEVQRRVEEWLERLEISHLSARSAHTLSGGEARRVSLARAFATRPEILLLDEPFSALDPPTRSKLTAEIKTLLETTRITTLFVTHDPNEAMLLGDRIAVLIGGEIRQIGPPDRVFSRPADEQVASFVGVETVLPGKVISAQDGLVTVDASGHMLEAVGDYPVGCSVLVCVRPEDITISTRDQVYPSSARNRISGPVTRVIPQGPLARIEIDCGVHLVALVTRASARDMGIVEGQTVQAAFKASAAYLIPRSN